MLPIKKHRRKFLHKRRILTRYVGLYGNRNIRGLITWRVYSAQMSAYTVKEAGNNLAAELRNEGIMYNGLLIVPFKHWHEHHGAL